MEINASSSALAADAPEELVTLDVLDIKAAALRVDVDHRLGTHRLTAVITVGVASIPHRRPVVAKPVIRRRGYAAIDRGIGQPS